MTLLYFMIVRSLSDMIVDGFKLCCYPKLNHFLGSPFPPFDYEKNVKNETKSRYSEVHRVVNLYETLRNTILSLGILANTTMAKDESKTTSSLLSLVESAPITTIINTPTQLNSHNSNFEGTVVLGVSSVGL